MWGTDWQPNLNQAKRTVNSQDNFLKQKTNKKSGNQQQVMNFPVVNTNPEGYRESIIRFEKVGLHFNSGRMGLSNSLALPDQVP